VVVVVVVVVVDDDDDDVLVGISILSVYYIIVSLCTDADFCTYGTSYQRL